MLKKSHLLGLTLALSIPLQVGAETFPSKPITFVVPYSPGGTTDLIARAVGKHISEAYKQPFIVENKPGAGGNIGMAYVAAAKADGYTLGMGAISTNAVNPHIYDSMPFDPRTDFTPISLLGTSTIVLEVNPSINVNNVEELISYAKNNPETIFGAAGTGTSMHLAGVLFSNMTDTQLQHVAYKGSAPAIMDLIGGRINVMFDNLPASLPHIKEGKIKALAAAGSNRNPQLPDVPTIEEAGLTGYAVDPWFAVYGPAKLPEQVTATLNTAFANALASDEVKTILENAGFSPKSSSTQELKDLSDSEYTRWQEIVSKANVTH